MEPILTILIGFAVLAFAVWIYILLPAEMAGNRGRSKLGWVLISLFFSPVIAVVGLLVLGDAPGHSLI